MAQTLSDLSKKLQSANYMPLNEEEIMRQSQNQYKNMYDQQVLGAQQAYETGEQAYDRQMRQVALNHDRQVEQVKEQTKHSVSAADRNSLTRGMQRSSYNLATLSNIQLAGDRAQVSIGEARARSEEDIAAQRTLKEQQLAQTLQQARAAYDTNVLAYADQLRDREYQRITDAARYQNELAMAMYEYQSKAEQQQRDYDRWLMEFNEGVRQFEASYQLKVDQMNASSAKNSSSSSGKSGNSKNSGSEANAAALGMGITSSGGMKILQDIADRYNANASNQSAQSTQKARINRAGMMTL